MGVRGGGVGGEECGSWRGAAPELVAILVGIACLMPKTVLRQAGSIRYGAGMPLDMCELCHRVHNAAHRCPVVRFDPTPWTHPADGAIILAVPIHVLPAFDVVCPHCRARSCPDETINCCGRGRLTLPIGEDVPSEFQDVILSAHVRSNIRRCCMFCSLHLWLLFVSLFTGTTWRLPWRLPGIAMYRYRIRLLF